MEKFPWWGFVALAGLAWGVYVPIIFFGGSELGGKPNARLMAILCVGVAYFVLAVLFPLFLFVSGQQEWPTLNATGLTFASLAGVAGAVGAICVIFASKAAVQQATGEFAEARAALVARSADADELARFDADKPVQLAKYRMFIAPLIFGIAPVINALLSTVWHPKPGSPLNFEAHAPDWKLVVGIALVAVGIALVLYSKEAGEVKRAPSPGGARPAPAVPTGVGS